MQVSGTPPTTIGAIGFKQPSPRVIVYPSDKNWGHFTDCPVILQNVLTQELTAIACKVCGTNKNTHNGFLIGINGMWQHLNHNHATTKPKLSDGESKEDYIVRTCRRDDVDDQTMRDILAKKIELSKVAPAKGTSDPGTTIRAGDRITVEAPAGMEDLPHIVRFAVNAVQEDHLRLLFCSECGANATSRSKFFAGVKGFADHI